MNALGNRDNYKKDQEEEQDDANADPLTCVSLVVLCSLQLTCPTGHIISCIVYLPKSPKTHDLATLRKCFDVAETYHIICA
jgi:hypothetical protein